MKLTALMVSTVLSASTVVPNKAGLNLHYLDRVYTVGTQCSAGKVMVSGARFVEKGLNQENKPALDERAKGDGVSKKINHFCMPASELERERKWGKSIYQTHVATGTKNQGTSFLVGKNIILTNHHIAVPVAQKPLDCRALEVLTRVGKPVWVGCKRILFCNPVQDFCFVEMKPVSPGVELSDLSEPLTLNAKPLFEQPAYIVGNSAALGIQGSRGAIVLSRAMKKAGEFSHNIPMVGGASGSPIINANGEVIGINHSHNGPKDHFRNFFDPEGRNYNVGTSSNFILSNLAGWSLFTSNLAGQHQYDPMVLFELSNLFRIR